MELITRETFNRWTQKSNWIQISEAVAPTGRQYTYLTPAGTLVIAQLDLKGNVTGVGQLVPGTPPPAILPQRKG